MGRYSSRRIRTYERNATGRERAREHIRAAKALDRELGGTVEDVKEYFFSLPQDDLNRILYEYEQRHGNLAREYAERTILKWKSGQVYMSGRVAERLFNLLPPVMPLKTKFRLIENLWKHVGPSSTKTYYIGLDADIDEVSRLVKKYLEEFIIHYEIPESLDIRFDWLSQGDVKVKQKLLNYFRQREKQLLSKALRIQLPVIINHLNNEKGNLTTHTTQELRVGKHVVRVEINEHVNGISEIAPATLAPTRTTQKSDNNWIWWVISIIILLVVLNK